MIIIIIIIALKCIIDESLNNLFKTVYPVSFHINYILIDILKL